MTIVRELRFEAAHALPNTPEGHRCRRLHGHNFRCEIHLTGKVEPRTGWIMDFGEIDRHFAPLRDQLDHHYLNEIAGLENPTSENLAIWIWDRLKPSLPLLSAVVVHETDDARSEYTGP